MDQKINIPDRLERARKGKVIVKEKNDPDFKLMATAFVHMFKQNDIR